MTSTIERPDEPDIKKSKKGLYTALVAGAALAATITVGGIVAAN